MWHLYADVLVLSQRYEKSTQIILEGVLQVMKESFKVDGAVMPIQAHLSLVLEQMGTEPEKQK